MPNEKTEPLKQNRNFETKIAASSSFFKQNRRFVARGYPRRRMRARKWASGPAGARAGLKNGVARPSSGFS